MCVHMTASRWKSEDLVVTVGLRDLLVLLDLCCLVVQAAKLPLGKSDAGLLVDCLHQRRQHLVDIYAQLSAYFKQSMGESQW